MECQTQSSDRGRIVKSTRLALLSLAAVVICACPYGLDTCKAGFVWREAFSNDHVCVSPRSRQQAGDDNAQAVSRLSAPDTCIQGYVWREAGPRDHVCVLPETRQQTLDENNQAGVRRVRP